MSRQTLTWLSVLKGNVRGCYNEWAFNGRSKMLLKGVWKMMLALEKYFWKNNKNKNTRERIYIPSLLLICFMVNSIASTKLETFESNILLEWGLSGTRKIFRVKLNIWKRKKCKVKYVKSVIMGRSRYDRYKNIKSNKRQWCNERVQCHRTKSLPKGI